MSKRSGKPVTTIVPSVRHGDQRTSIAGTEEYELDEIESFAQDDVVHDEDDVDAEPERPFSETDRPCARARSQPQLRRKYKLIARPKIRS